MDSSASAGCSDGAYIDDSGDVRFRGGAEFSFNTQNGLTHRGYSSATFGAFGERAGVLAMENGLYGISSYLGSFLEIGRFYPPGGGPPLPGGGTPDGLCLDPHPAQQGYNFIGGCNTVMDNGAYDVHVAGSGMRAHLTYWGRPVPSASQFLQDYPGQVDYGHYLSYDPGEYFAPPPAPEAASPMLAGLRAVPVTATGQEPFVARARRLLREDPGAALALLDSVLAAPGAPETRAAQVLYPKALQRAGRSFEAKAIAEAALEGDALALGRSAPGWGAMPPEDQAILASRLFYRALLEEKSPAEAEKWIPVLARLGDEDARNGLLQAVYRSVAETAPSAAPSMKAARTPEQPFAAGWYPNPVATTGTVWYRLPEDADVQVTLYDVLGREVARPVDAPEKAGLHEVPFNASALPSGVYFFRASAGGDVVTGSVTLVR